MPIFDKYNTDVDISGLDENIDENNIDVEVNISVDEFLTECDNNEIEETIEWLKDNDFLKNVYVVNINSISHEMFLESVDKIVKNYYQLTNEEQELIEKIAKRF